MAESKAVAKPKKQTLVLEGDPDAQLDYAQKAAKALMKRVNSKKKQVIIGGKTYLEFGDWQTLARFFGATVGVEWTKPIERNGKLEGYEARAIVYQHGQTISAAEASCMKIERNWAGRDEFAVKSMAQTRASAKALRNAFGWVAELAGYSSTPAEEMTGESFDEPKKATEKQINWLRNVASEYGTEMESADEIDDWIEKVIGYRPDQLSIRAVGQAVKKIEAVIQEEKASKNNEDVAVELTEQEVSEGIKNLDNIPY